MEIKLTGKKGGIAIVSEKDYDRVIKYEWYQNKRGYVETKIKGKFMRLHKFITNAEKRQSVDHINHNKLDNRKENLRIITTNLNSENRSINKNKKGSKYKGVFYDKASKKYQVTTNIGGKRLNMGRYDTESEAAEVMDMFLVHTGKDHVQLNFPEKRDEYLKKKYVPYKTPYKNKYIGVKKYGNKFYSRINIKGKEIRIKVDKDELICANAYDQYIVDNEIPQKKLNFPENYPEYNPDCIIKTNCKPTDNNDVIQLIIKSHPDMIVLIDKNDYDKVKYYAWCYANGYISANVKGKTMRLNRFLMDMNDPDIYIDHIDKNSLNNIKANLRISNDEKNPHNSVKMEGASSEYYGVYLETYGNQWISHVTYQHKRTIIGRDYNEIDAARRRDLYVLIYYPDEHYSMNFVWNDNDIKNWGEKLSVIKHVSELYFNRIKYIQSMKNCLINNELEELEKINIKYKSYLKNFDILTLLL